MGEKKEEYDFYKSIKICVRCHKRTAEPNRVMCLECADKDNERSKIKRENNIDIMKKRDLDKYYQLKEQGICTYCKHEKAVVGKTKCSKCLKKIRSRQAANRNDLSRSEWVSYEICYLCGKNHTIPGKGVCESCYDVLLKSIQKCNETRKEGFNDFWKQQNKLVFARK